MQGLSIALKPNEMVFITSKVPLKNICFKNCADERLFSSIEVYAWGCVLKVTIECVLQPPYSFIQV